MESIRGFFSWLKWCFTERTLQEPKNLGPALEEYEERGMGLPSVQFITTSAEVTPNGGLVRESPPKWP